MARGSDGVSAVSRAVEILDAFSVDAPFLTLGAIAQRSGLPLSSVHRIVAELAAHGLIERMPDRRYRVGIRLWEMGSRTPGALGFRELALPFLHAVQSRVMQHTQLAVRADLDVLVVERLSARDAVINGSVVGGRIAMQHSASGMVMLAAGDPELLARVVGHGLAPLTPTGIRTERELRSILARTRRDGYAVTPGFVHAESRGIAAAVHGPGGAVVGAIQVVVPNDDAPTLEQGLLLRRAADRIGEALVRSALPSGHPGAGPGGSYRGLVSSSERSMEYFEQLLDG